MPKPTNLLSDDGTASMATLLMISHHVFRRSIMCFAIYIILAVILMACAPVTIQNEIRSDKEIQAVFEKNKWDLYEIYKNALREQPGLSGSIMLKIVVEPSGRVSGCDVGQSTLADPDLGLAICTRIRDFDFGQKNLSQPDIFSYPIDFIPR
jgi:hypothetical protein